MRITDIRYFVNVVKQNRVINLLMYSGEQKHRKLDFVLRYVFILLHMYCNFHINSIYDILLPYHVNMKSIRFRLAK